LAVPIVAGMGSHKPAGGRRIVGTSCRDFHVACADVIVARLDVDDHATEALRHAGRGLRRHVAASIPHAVLPRLVRALETVLVKIGLGASG
jgi:hypothetical protein